MMHSRHGQLDTHAIALLLGLAGAWIIATFAPQATDTASVVPRASSRARPPGTARLSSPAEFRQACVLFGSQPVSKEDREKLQGQLFEAWARRDPVGLLAYLDQCAVWPESLRFYWLSDLARTRPDLLLDFAIRNGCDGAANLLTECDQQTVVRLIDALPAGDVGPRLISNRDDASKKLGASGVAADHPNAANLQGLALCRLKEGDIDGFLSQFALVGDHDKQSSLAWELGQELRADKLDGDTLATIMRLPAEYRDPAAHGVFSGPSEYPETRATLRNWIVKLMENGMKEAAKDAVSGLFVEHDPRVNDEIAAWIQTLPTEQSWLPLAKELATNWWFRDDAAAATGVATLPPGPFRDELLADLANHLLLNPERYEKPQLDRLLPLIENPKLRGKFERWPWGEPFGEPSDDPPDSAEPAMDPSPGSN